MSAIQSFRHWKRGQAAMQTTIRHNLDLDMAIEPDQVKRGDIARQIEAADVEIRRIDMMSLGEPADGKRLSTGAKAPGPGARESRLNSAPTSVGRASDTRATTRAKKDRPQLSGYASVSNSDSENLGFIEQIARGAFRNVLHDDVRFLINHNSDLILGRNGVNLRLYEDATGLLFYVDLRPDNSLARDAHDNVEAGFWTQCSFAFFSNFETDEWFYPSGKLPRRIIHDVTGLFDCSIVSYPAYSATSVQAIGSMKRSQTAPLPQQVVEPAQTYEEWLSDLEEGEYRQFRLDRMDAKLASRITPERKRAMDVRLRKATRIINRNTTAESLNN